MAYLFVLKIVNTINLIRLVYFVKEELKRQVSLHFHLSQDQS
jgi:hypothetical protein